MKKLKIKKSVQEIAKLKSGQEIYIFKYMQKQPISGVLRKRCSENMQQIYRRTPMMKCDFNKVALKLYRNRTSTWVFSSIFAAYFQNTFL